MSFETSATALYGTTGILSISIRVDDDWINDGDLIETWRYDGKMMVEIMQHLKQAPSAILQAAGDFIIVLLVAVNASEHTDPGQHV